MNVLISPHWETLVILKDLVNKTVHLNSEHLMEVVYVIQVQVVVFF